LNDGVAAIESETAATTSSSPADFPIDPTQPVSSLPPAQRSQKLFDQALSWIKKGGSFEKVTSLLRESLELSKSAHGDVDLKTARISWQLASQLLTRGDMEQAEPQLLSVLTTREKVLPETSDELYDVYADLSYVHLFRAQNSVPAPS